MILYFGESPEAQTVKVPDFVGMNRQQASTTAGENSLYILVTGNYEISHTVTVAYQNIPAGTDVPAGTTVELKFVDTKAAD